MLTHIKQWLEPPHFEGDEEKNRVARLMNTLGLYFALLLAAAAAIFIPFFATDKIAAGIIIAILTMLYIVSRYLVNRGQLKLGGSIIVFGAWAIFQGMAFFSGGVNSPVSITVVAMSIIIGLLIDITVGSVIVLLSILVELGLAILQTNQYPLPQILHFTPLATWFWFALALGFLYGTVNLVTRNLQSALNSAHKENERRKNLEDQLRYQSSHDVLTGIYNRLFFSAELERLERSREFPISFVIVDVDGLKIINDTQGHTKGDELLQHTASVLRSVFRDGDVVARIGGDEFAVLLPATDSATMEQIVSRVKERLVEEIFKHPDMSVKLSLGASTAEKGTVVESFKLADQRMYADKAAHKSNKSYSSTS